MLIKADKTGRKTFGDKIDESVSFVNIAGIKVNVRQCDTWSSGEYPGDGEYIRCVFLEAPKVDPWPNIK
jgi:hypothetical protein